MRRAITTTVCNLSLSQVSQNSLPVIKHISRLLYNMSVILGVTSVFDQVLRALGITVAYFRRKQTSCGSLLDWNRLTLHVTAKS